LPLLSPKQASARNEDEIAEGVNFVAFRVPAKPVFPLHLHRSRGPGKQLALLRNPKGKERDMSEFRDVYSKITDRIIADLEQGVRPWMRPWSAEHAAGKITRPLRHNGVPYKGINVVMLWSASVLKGYACPLWLTFKQALELGGNVRKGEHGELVVYANRITRTETGENGEETEREIPFLKGYTVFNAEQCEGLPAHYSAKAEPPALPPAARIERADRFFAATGADSDEGGHLFQSDPGHHSNLMAASLGVSRRPVLIMSRRRSRGQAVAHGLGQIRSRFAEQS